MLISRLLRARRADETLPADIRAALIESLFAPIASLLVGAIACSIIGIAVALRVGNWVLMANSIAIFAVGILRVVSALLYRRGRNDQNLTVTKIWEHVYELGAWGFAALLGLLCWLTITQTSDATLQMAVSTTTAGYSGAISGRNAGRPIIALGQLTLCSLPMAIALLLYPDFVHKALGVVVLMFIYGMVDITLSLRDLIVQAFTMTRKEAALAARFEEQANRFDVALNNMSHGLCMLDQANRLQVWNERFIELLRLQNAPIQVGMRMPLLIRHSMRAGNYPTKSIKQVLQELGGRLRKERFGQFYTSPDGERTIAVSRRMKSDGGSVIILEDVTERKRAQEKIAHLAKYDELTGLANRTLFREHITAMLAHPDEKHLTIHLIDLDRFKAVNDTLGHPIGDKLLRLVASRLSPVIRPIDMIARFGGDEFVVVQAATDRLQDAKRLANRLASTLKEPFEIEGHRIDIGASIGIAMAPKDGLDADELLKKADMALYASKAMGGDSHRFFALEMEEAAQERRALELDLRDALNLQQLDLHYQPLVDLRTGKITSCEALLRWMHPVRGNIPPSVFILIAEETGLIVPLGEWALNRACSEAAAWPNGVKVAVNLSPVQFREPSLPLQVASALVKAGLSAQRLELEVTERVLLEDNNDTLAIMEQLNSLGVQLSLDDFGTGYSSLNYLRKFPFHKIKIDRSFICDLGEARDARAIIGAVANLGANLDKVVVAEGIETEEQSALVAAQGCHEGQGYLFGRPMPSAAIRARLSERTEQRQMVA